EELAGQAAEGALEQSLEILDRPHNRARLARILGSPSMQDAARDVSASVVAGAFDGVAMGTGLGEQDDLYTRFGRSIGTSLDQEITPAAARLTHSSVDAALEAMLAERHVARLEGLVERVGAAAAAGLTQAVDDELAPALATAIERELGPALATTLEQDVLPAVGRGMQSPEVQEAIVRSTSSIGVGAAVGAERGLEQVRGGEDGTVQLFGRTVAIGLLVATVAAIAFALALVVLAVMLVRASRRQRQMYEDSRRREQLLLELFH